LAAGLRPDPLGDLMHSPDSVASTRGATSKRRKERDGGEGRDLLIRGGREGEGPTSKGDGIEKRGG